MTAVPPMMRFVSAWADCGNQSAASRKATTISVRPRPPRRVPSLIPSPSVPAGHLPPPGGVSPSLVTPATCNQPAQQRSFPDRAVPPGQRMRRAMRGRHSTHISKGLVQVGLHYPHYGNQECLYSVARVCQLADARAAQRPSSRWTRISNPKHSETCSLVTVASIDPCAITLPSRSNKAWLVVGGSSSRWCDTSTVASAGFAIAKRCRAPR